MSGPARIKDLPEALVSAGLRLLDEDGSEGLTLRRAARLAGVSHAAPAHHFGGLPGLQAAIARRGFEMFHDSLQDSQSDAPADPFRRLLHTNEAYLCFARRHAALFRLMFTQTDHADRALREAAGRCYAVLRRNCAPFATCPAEAVRIESAVWALTHGYATLRMADPRPNAPAPAPSYETLLRMLLPAAND